MEKTDFRPGKSSTSKVFKPAHKKLVSRQFVDTSINTNLRQLTVFFLADKVFPLLEPGHGDGEDHTGIVLVLEPLIQL